MSNTLTIEQVGDSLTRAIACLNETKAPVKVMSGGATAAYLVAPQNLIVYDPLITPEEAIVLAHDLAMSEADIAAGRVFTLDEAWERLRAVCEARGETL